jgi:hypothetical protein
LFRRSSAAEGGIVPIQPTFPGVYIEEVPSPVRTIVGVSTSVTAFVGYTARGVTNAPSQLFSYGDFERAFGGLDLDSPVSYAVQQFFNNGGLEAWVVRVASGAAAAGVELRDTAGAGSRVVLVAHAASKGLWGNNLRLLVDYGASNPLDQFNLSIVELREQNGAMVVGATETHRNLSMNSRAPNYAVDAVNANSSLIRLERPAAGLPAARTGESRSGVIDLATFAIDAVGPGTGHERLMLSVDGRAPVELRLAAPGAGTAVAKLTAIANDIAAKAAAKGLNVTAAVQNLGGQNRRIVLTSGMAGDERSSVRVTRAAVDDAAAHLRLGVAQGGRETDGSAPLRPAASGTMGDDISGLSLPTLASAPTVKLTVDFPGAKPDVDIAALPLWTAADGLPGSFEELRQRLENAIRAAAATTPAIAAELAEARVLLVDGRLQVVASGDPDVIVGFDDVGGDTTATKLKLLGAGTSQNVSRYALGTGGNVAAKSGVVGGSDGTVPTAAEILGNEAAKTGLFALEDVDLFNILCLPAQSDLTLLSAAMSYCERRRAFLIVDVPATTSTLLAAQTWIKAASTPKSKNAAAYFPWVVLPDPLQDYRPRPFPPSGILAGLYARTDGTRGIWKAPAGTEANLRGPQGVAYKLSDAENGTLNPLALNAIRALPIYGTVAWGARTLVGADQMASEWKYIPVRRLALYIEESLYRGTQWVIFEPNDEPLWSQIRLNVGAFMHNLFRQGAFQGVSPREAYLVKCDKETTTQNDIDRGIVNILVGFAPLKPAEFVILKISQLAGQVEA